MAASLGTQLPAVRGCLVENAPLQGSTWLRVGGPASVLFTPHDLEDLQEFLRAKPAHIPVHVLGLGSNLLVRDGGICGVVIKLGRGFAYVHQEQNHRVRVGAATADALLATTAGKAGIGGLEFFCTIPGSVGGALWMNAGAYGGDTAQVFVEATAVDMGGNLHTFGKQDMAFSYRRGRACPHALSKAGATETGTTKGYDGGGLIFVEAVFQGVAKSPHACHHAMMALRAQREKTQPVKSRTGGSTFKNPTIGALRADGAVTAEKAWQLIDAAGCRGLRQGGAKISDKHCNFLVNTGHATAWDLEALATRVQHRVARQSGVLLEWEIQRWGSFDADMQGEGEKLLKTSQALKKALTSGKGVPVTGTSVTGASVKVEESS